MNTLTPSRLQQFQRSLALLAKAIAADGGSAVPAPPPAQQRPLPTENATLTAVPESPAGVNIDTEQEAAEFFSHLAWEKQQRQNGTEKDKDKLRIVPGSVALTDQASDSTPPAQRNGALPARPDGALPARPDNAASGDNDDDDGSKKFFQTLPWDGDTSE